MRIMVWNCRGVNDADGPTVPFLCLTIRKFSPHILFPNETKEDSIVITKLARKSNYTKFDYVEPSVFADGLGLFWSPFVKLIVVEKSTNYIAYKVVMK